MRCEHRQQQAKLDQQRDAEQLEDMADLPLEQAEKELDAKRLRTA
ncbi:MAG TPA: hypothetical protein VGE28_00885 [Pseudomonas sp.]